MTPLVVDAWARQSDCSSASNGVAATRKRRVVYTDRIFVVFVDFEGLVGLVGFAESGGWDLKSEMRLVRRASLTSRLQV